jgi:hypothetical protein
LVNGIVGAGFGVDDIEDDTAGLAYVERDIMVSVPPARKFRPMSSDKRSPPMLHKSRNLRFCPNLRFCALRIANFAIFGPSRVMVSSTAFDESVQGW